MEDMGESVRVIDASIQPWNLEEWFFILENVDKNDVDRSKVSLSIKHPSFPHLIRPRIWFWLVNIKKYDNMSPYKMYDKCK
jgi:hypothetical protein